VQKAITRNTRRYAAASAAALAVCLSLLSASGAKAGPPIAYPDLHVLMPTSDISIMHKNGLKLLEFTHITEDAGAGPLEMRPVYNATTGISQAYQALYTMTSPGVWQYVESLPIVGPMIWTPPSDYNFPLDKFWLYGLNAEGGPGAIVSASPKDLFCMTSDVYVGGVPNTPNENQYPGGACAEPEGRLGLTVGWGDQYEATDGGEGIDITSLPNGTYWLRGEVDPDHYLRESNTSNNITDTKLQIEGDTVRVLEQTSRDSTPPSVNLTSPATESTVAGTVSLAATASGPAPISSVQFLLDGEPLGAPVTSPPYTLNWTVGSTAPGRHFLSAQATDSRGFKGTATDTPITVGTKVGSITIANVVTQTGESSVTTAPFSTSQGGDVLLAFADADGPSAGGQTLTVSGGGLAWSLVQRANAQAGDAEVWTAKATAPLSGATVTASAADGGYHESLTVAALSGAAGVGRSATAGASSGAPSISLTSTGGGSVAFATGNDWDRAIARTLAPEQELLSQDLETSAGNSFWTQYAAAPSTGGGQTLTVNDSAPTSDRWNLAAVEVLPTSEGPDTQPPTVSIVNPVPGQTVTEASPVTANAMDDVAVAWVQFYLDGKPLGGRVAKPPYAVSWSTREVANGPHTLTAQAIDTSGNVGASAPVEVTVENPPQKGPCFVVDVNTSVEGTRRVTTQPITTGEAGEQLLAFVSANGPPVSEAQSAKVSGGGLAWRLVRRANSQPGDAEIWTATASRPLKHKRIKSSLKAKGYDELLTVIAVQMSNGIGASAANGGATGAPSVSLMTSEEGSLVYGVGGDWSSATPPSLGPNQVLLHDDLDTAVQKTFWSQYLGTVTGPAGEPVTLNDTAPTSDQWNMAAVEIRGDGPGL
jgi:hypothetical protein